MKLCVRLSKFKPHAVDIRPHNRRIQHIPKALVEINFINLTFPATFFQQRLSMNLKKQVEKSTKIQNLYYFRPVFQN